MIKTIIGAGQRLEYQEVGRFFRLMEAQSVVDIVFYKGGAEVTRAESVQEGYAESFQGEGFDRVIVSTAVEQEVQFVVRQNSVVAYDKAPTGSVVVENVNGAFSQAAATVTDTSAELVPANPFRRYLLIQNNHESAAIFIRLDGEDAAAGGVKIAAGGSYELQGFVPTGAITAAGEIASNTAVIVVEG